MEPVSSASVRIFRNSLEILCKMERKMWSAVEVFGVLRLSG